VRSSICRAAALIGRSRYRPWRSMLTVAFKGADYRGRRDSGGGAAVRQVMIPNPGSVIGRGVYGQGDI
jgi:hypothetical protein